MKKISLIIPILLINSGCTIHPPWVELESPIKFNSFHYKDSHKHKHGSKFCPPGQAKKGKC